MNEYIVGWNLHGRRGSVDGDKYVSKAQLNGERWHQVGGGLHKRGHVASGTRPCVAAAIQGCYEPWLPNASSETTDPHFARGLGCWGGSTVKIHSPRQNKSKVSVCLSLSLRERETKTETERRRLPHTARGTLSRKSTYSNPNRRRCFLQVRAAEMKERIL